MLSFLLFSSLAAAQDLYEPAPPANASFVRVVHADADANTAPAIVSDKKYGPVDFRKVTPYMVVLEGSRDAKVGTVESSLSFEAGEFYTVALVDGQLQNQKDARNTNLAKALLVLYNYTDKAGARLTTGDGSLEIIASVGSQAQNSRAVNALSTDLAVWLGETRIAVFPGIELERSRAYSAVLIDTPQGPKAAWIENTTR
jgi:alginate O-acetyltransferase complex protein AlgF